MPFDPLHQIDSVAFHPDSAKVALTNIAQEIATNPNQFLQDLIHDAIAFGIKVLAAIVIYAIGAWLIKRADRVFDTGKINCGFSADGGIYLCKKRCGNIIEINSPHVTRSRKSCKIPHDAAAYSHDAI